MYIDGELDIHPFHDPDTGETFTLAYTDPLSYPQISLFNRLTREARNNGETDLRIIFAYAVDKFNEEAQRQGWVTRARFWERYR